MSLTSSFSLEKPAVGFFRAASFFTVRFISGGTLLFLEGGDSLVRNFEWFTKEEICFSEFHKFSLVSYSARVHFYSFISLFQSYIFTLILINKLKFLLHVFGMNGKTVHAVKSKFCFSLVWTDFSVVKLLTLLVKKNYLTFFYF